MKDPLAAKDPADNEIKQDTMNGKDGVTRFAAREAAHGIGQLGFFKKDKKDFDASEAGRVFEVKIQS